MVAITADVLRGGDGSLLTALVGVESRAAVQVFWYQPRDGGKPYLVIDIDSMASLPVCVYRNGEPLCDES